MKVVLDTNQLYGDYLLRGPQFATVEDFLRRSSSELCIPAVVVEEITRHYRRAYEEAASRRDKVNRISRVVGDEMPTLRPPHRAEEDYRRALSERLRSMQARVITLPDITINAVLERDLSERRPFDDKGRGFRDTLIWESIFHDCSQHNELIVFVTNDAGFKSPSARKEALPVLHGDLATELETAGHDPGRIQLVDSLQGFIDRFVLPSADASYTEGERLEGTFAESLDAQYIRQSFTDNVEGEIQVSLPWIIRTKGASDASVTFLRWVGDARLVEAVDLGNDKAQVIIRTQLLFDTKLRSDQDEFTRLMELSKDSPVFLRDMRWDPEVRVFRFELRVILTTDIVFRWDMNTNKPEGSMLLRFGFDENNMWVI
jgi:predicted nucleic acid-binding protein